jgi:hypothetical protein
MKDDRRLIWEYIDSLTGEDSKLKAGGLVIFTTSYEHGK